MNSPTLSCEGIKILRDLYSVVRDTLVTGDQSDETTKRIHSLVVQLRKDFLDNSLHNYSKPLTANDQRIAWANCMVQGPYQLKGRSSRKPAYVIPIQAREKSLFGHKYAAGKH